VTGFGSNPGNLTMHRYVPDGLPAGSPVVLLLHGCAQGPVEYFDHSGWRGVADAGGFTVIAAGQQTANNASRCFNWFEPADTARGSGETLSLKQMVDRVLADQGADANRVFVSGLSAGGGMTATMLAAYPDVFAGGAVVAGLPHGCARSMIEAFSCMSPGKNQSPQAWGDLVRAAHSGHSGARPPVSVWHGGQDYVVATANLTESVKQWTDAHGIDQTPDATSTLPQSTTRSEYHDSSGKALVTTYLTPGNGHGTPIDPPSCGASGSYFLPGLCSASYMAQDWGIATGGGDPTDPSDPTDPTDPDPADPTDPSDPADPDPSDPDPSDPAPACFTASNYAHTQAGRAVHRLGLTYAVGSDAPLGLWNLAVTTSLVESPPGYFTHSPGGCP
uniref:extracellular catalytic domain type 1 short-chain-length polyhydroxyalkanoate depolymerase n=1 Tax=Streptomyces sp. SM12 TaxID=1071602 RepID=UPI000CD4A412